VSSQTGAHRRAVPQRFRHRHRDANSRQLCDAIAGTAFVGREQGGRRRRHRGRRSGEIRARRLHALDGDQQPDVGSAGVEEVAGRVQMMIATPTTGLAHVKDGKLRAFATTLSRRSPLLPEVPTIAEAGMPEFSITSWVALFGPARMPREVLERLNKEFGGAMARPEVQASMEKQGFALNPSSPEQLADFVKQQLESYRRILRAAGVQPE